MATTPTSNDLTRQQLEELDSLLQRMLAAPTARPEPRHPAAAVPPVVESWRIDRPAPLPPRLHLVMPDVPAPPAAFVPAEPPIPPTAPVASLPDMVFEPPVSRVPVTPSVPFLPPFPAIAGTPSDPFPDEIEPPELERLDPIPLYPADPEPTTAVEPPVEAAVSQGVPVAMWPIFAVNWVAEECLKALGGESLTRPVAKWAFGLLGIAMLAGAAYWTLAGRFAWHGFR